MRLNESTTCFTFDITTPVVLALAAFDLLLDYGPVAAAAAHVPAAVSAC